MLALATIVKLTPLLAIGVFLVRRRWKWLAFYALWMVLLMGIGVWHLGWQNHRLYLSKLSTLSCGVPGLTTIRFVALYKTLITEPY